jgi:twinkle protein
MNGKVVNFTRHGQPGYHALDDVPQRPSVASIARSTGYWELDQIWMLYPGQFTVVTGMAGHGKSTLLLNVIANGFQTGLRSFLYVPENEAHIREILARIWGDRPAWEVFASTGCFIQTSLPDSYDAPPRTLDWVLDQAVVAIQRDGVNLLLIDPFNEIEWAKPRDMPIGQYIGECLKSIKQFCRLYSVSVIMVAHPTKAGIADGRVPGGADIDGSMNWANKCDNGLTVMRDKEGTTSRVVSWKVREIGAGKRGVCYFDVDEDTGIFTPQKGAVSL